MYIDYSKLWKLLVDKGITKTELMELSGLNSRTLAKLSKNKTVTTDTLSKICEVLHCDVCDIMECVDEDKLSLYTLFRRNGKQIEETEYCKIYALNTSKANYKICVSKQAANKATHIHCKENGSIYREQLYMFGGRSTPRREETFLIKPIREHKEIFIVVIKGKPALITGLDEGIFVSAHGTLKTERDVYVMSETAFKLFEETV